MAKWPYSTAAWQRLRRLKLREHPLCEACLAQGRIEPASAVDHRVPVSAGGYAFPALADLASLCAACHNAKSNAERRGEDWLRKGCDVRGYPLDPAHPWYRS
jgi:5-methylcytosine-specific restriction enzyme A